MDNLLIIINTDIKEIFKLSAENDDGKLFIMATRCINTCFLAIDTIFIDADTKALISKKLLVIYNLLINLPDIIDYDIHLQTIYDKIKIKFVSYAENFHLKVVNKNREYHLNMIRFYNNTTGNTIQLYNYYNNIGDYHNCLKLIERHRFWDRMHLLNNICVALPVSTIIEYALNNAVSPLLLQYLGLNTEIVDKCVANYAAPVFTVDHVAAKKHTNPNSAILIDTSTNSSKCIMNMLKSLHNVDIYDGTVPSTDYNIIINMCSIDNRSVLEFLSRRPAPIQIGYLGYMGSIKQTYIDYYITDSYFANLYAKPDKLLILPNSFIPCDLKERFSHTDNTPQSYDVIIANINKKNKTKDETYDFVIKYFYKIIKFNIDKVFNGIYNKEFLIERQIKLIMSRFSLTDDNFLLFQANYNKIKNLKRRSIKVSGIYGNIILPRCKQKGSFKFCCLSGLRKLSSRDLAIYKIILEKTPKSVLYIMESTPIENRENILTHFAEAMRERIYFIPYIPQKLNMIRLPYFDCILDTHCYNIKTTTFDILWSGVPIITVNGSMPPTRITTSILLNAGLDILVCKSIDTYIELATKMASDKSFYNTTKTQVEKIRDNIIFKKNIFVDSLNRIISSITLTL
jgi:hypothetical protein